ncbi:hypothetical protein D3C86_1276030 [compost metagenome]
MCKRRYLPGFGPQFHYIALLFQPDIHWRNSLPGLFERYLAMDAIELRFPDRIFQYSVWNDRFPIGIGRNCRGNRDQFCRYDHRHEFIGIRGLPGICPGGLYNGRHICFCRTFHHCYAYHKRCGLQPATDSTGTNIYIQ